MNVELLGEDELLVELEVRGLRDPTRGVTPELKNALAERLRAEREDCMNIPWDQHEAAVERPEQEVATCLRKLHAVQQYLLKGIRADKTVSEMCAQVATRLIHVRGRIERGSMCPAFNPRSTSLHIVMQMLWGMVKDLVKGVVTAADVAVRLSRVVIKIDRPCEISSDEEPEEEEDAAENEDDEGSSCEEVEAEEEVEEEDEDEEVVDEEVEESGEGDVSSKEIVEEGEMHDEIEEEVGEADIRASQEDEEAVEKVDEDEGEEKEEPENGFSQEGEVDKGEVQEEKVEENDKFEDPVLIDCMISSNTNGPLQNLDSDPLPQMERLVSKPSDATFPSTKGSVVVLVESPNQITGDSGKRARNWCGMLRQNVSTRVRFKGLKCNHIMDQFRAWIEWLIVRAQIPVDRLLGVLDLRLRDEVLAKTNRRVEHEDA